MRLCFSGPVARVLLFNTSGERDSAAMLKLLVVSTERLPVQSAVSHSHFQLGLETHAEGQWSSLRSCLCAGSGFMHWESRRWEQNE